MLEFVQPSLTAVSTALTILKSGKSLLPQSSEAKALKTELENLRSQMELSDSQIAKVLEYKLCKCTFPPQIMLFKKDQNADTCPNCGHSEERPAGSFVAFSEPKL